MAVFRSRAEIWNDVRGVVRPQAPAPTGIPGIAALDLRDLRKPRDEVVVMERPQSEEAAPIPPPAPPEKIKARQQPRTNINLDEYAALAQEIGLATPALTIERFAQFLQAKDWPLFALAEVKSYMDAKAKAESAEQAGWHWRPLREKDHIAAHFGFAARRKVDSIGGGSGPVEHAASDFYEGPGEGWSYSQSTSRFPGRVHTVQFPSPMAVYDKLVPLHALRKVATIEREFKEAPVSFFVCDYAPAPHIGHADPFLMAVITNPQLGAGVGRFVIDFWDEPGFGIDKMLA